ncbi:MAG: S46 family peptidase [Caulobacteraceae bacterium]|nr:S46 family peptidase [Caulobacteraceae bacterium]
MWPFDQAPVVQVRRTLGVTLDSRWLDHLRAASVRLTSGCSGSIVSPEGLALTNHHCTFACLEHLSGPGRDLVRDGFQADRRGEEAPCPGLGAEILVSIKDVTRAVFEAGRGKTGGAYADARQTAIADAERAACGADRRYRCQVVSFYDGGLFKMYKYRRYDDVRLVFTPEFQTGFFGGDPDNFNFPRYDLDCAFLRLYDRGRPAATPDHLDWSTSPPGAGEPVFVAGSPGVTERRLTVAQFQTLRDVAVPLLQAQNAELHERLTALASQGPEMRRITAGPLFAIENTRKILEGRQAALGDAAFMAARQREEAETKARLAADPQLAAQVRDPWTEIEARQAAYARQFVVWRQLESAAGEGSQLFLYARDLVRAAAERGKPTGQRLPEFSDSRLPLMEKLILADRPTYPALEQLYLEVWLADTQRLLGPEAAATAMLLGGDAPAALARRLVAGSRLGDRTVRRALWNGGAAAVLASGDPMIKFVLATDPLARAAREVWEDEVTGPVEDAAERIVRARYILEGPEVYPDATSTLRLSYGKVAGWEAAGRKTSPFTTFGGLYGRATGAPPYDLPPRWLQAKGKLDPDAVLDFVTTNDIVGGSSGSPVVDAKGRIVGTAFDGNIYSIAGDFTYDSALNRTIAVSTAAITEALAKVYGRSELVKELVGG